MRLVHKSLDIRPEVWRQLRINAELSGVPLRDYLSYLIESSRPVSESDGDSQAMLARVVEENRQARLSSRPESAEGGAETHNPGGLTENESDLVGR